MSVEQVNVPGNGIEVNIFLEKNNRKNPEKQQWRIVPNRTLSIKSSNQL